MGRSSVEANERGAIALIAVFFAVFAVAMLYSLIGTVEVVFFRERMQDAADSAALSSAIMHARSMNFIVLINIVMAALVAILVAIKLVQALCILGMVIAAALAWPTFGATLVAIPPLKVVSSAMQSSYDSLKPPIDQALEVLNMTADAVKSAAPLAADAIADATVTANFTPPVDVGFTSGSRRPPSPELPPELPVENDPFPVLCGKGGFYAGKIAMMPIDEIFGSIPGVGAATDELSSALGGMSSTFSDWFCGSGSSGDSNPPSYPHNTVKSLPEMPTAIACSEESTPPANGQRPKDVETDTCTRSERFEADASPVDSTGECQDGHDCSLTGPYEERVSVARVQCDPRETPAPYWYWYQLREGSVTYRWDGEFWRREEPRYDSLRAIKGNTLTPPCGPTALRPFIAEGYNLTVRRSDDVSEVLPVCSNEEAPFGRPGPRESTTRRVDFKQVTHILGCKKRIRVDVSVGDDTPGGDGGDSRSSKRVITGAELGDENFQIRALMLGKFDSEAGRIVRVALWNQPEPEDPLARLRKFGKYSVAQAEYFYDGSDGRDEWMWNMNWRARLRRFRMPESEAFDVFRATCRRVLGDRCDEAVTNLREVQDVIAH